MRTFVRLNNFTSNQISCFHLHLSSSILNFFALSLSRLPILITVSFNTFRSSQYGNVSWMKVVLSCRVKYLSWIDLYETPAQIRTKKLLKINTEYVPVEDDNIHTLKNEKKHGKRRVWKGGKTPFIFISHTKKIKTEPWFFRCLIQSRWMYKPLPRDLVHRKI